MRIGKKHACTLTLMTAYISLSSLAFFILPAAAAEYYPFYRKRQCAAGDPYEEKCAENCKNGTASKSGQCYQRCMRMWPGCPVQSVVRPKYYVMGLLYAPPDCKGASCSVSTVVYGNSSSAGTTTSIESSLTQASSATLTANLTLNVPTGPDTVKEIGSLKASGSSAFSATTTNGSSETISHTSSRALTVKAAGSKDGVDHQQDRFEILLNPAVIIQTQNAAKDYLGRVVKALSIEWTLGTSEPTPFSYRLSADELTQLSNASASSRDNSYKCPGTNLDSTKGPTWTASQDAECQQLKKLGFTHTDFTTILALDPFVGEANPADIIAKYPNRFVPVNWSWPYVSSGDTCLLLENGSLSNSIEHDVTSSYKTELKTGFTAGAEFKPVGVSFSRDWTFTVTSTTKNSTSGTNSATANLACPSKSYVPPRGKTFLVVYWDTLYGSFLFLEASVPSTGLITRGHLIDKGVATTGRLVELTYNGHSYKTTTDEKGNYEMYLLGEKRKSSGPIPGQVRVGSRLYTIDLSAVTEIH
jgi:hypothetical protein